MTETADNPLGNDAAGAPSPDLRLVCPQCKAQYRPQHSTQGRRVRCRHCGHVWRDASGAVDAVAKALGTAASTWSQIGAARHARKDQASSVGQMVKKMAQPPRPLAAEWVGRTLGRYKLKAVLGQGAMGYVYEADDQDLKRTVAVKLLPTTTTTDHEPAGMKLFLQEARVAAKLQHPNCVTIYEVGREDGTYFFAMECVHGMTLAKLIEQHGALPANEVCYIIARVAAALAAGHALGIVHRDVKPGNIMIDASGNVKLTDFGLADVKGIEGIKELSKQILGTPGWISPEVARGERATAASDIYGLGLTLYYAMTKDRLIQAETKSAMVRMQQKAKSLRRERLPGNWPPRLRDIALQCLQADPKDRYQSADMLAGDLLRALVPDETDATVVLGSGRIEDNPKLVSPIVSYVVLGLLLLVASAVALIWWGILR